ncbi:MAG: hypothetical protein ACI8Y4_000667, partial [Candidatus Poriferisodalaceae bacterium]
VGVLFLAELDEADSPIAVADCEAVHLVVFEFLIELSSEIVAAPTGEHLRSRSVR